ncbi:ring finger domain containing protein [Nitzschia inconspicua]|uniref:Ring finger domain containing protein n=1 Tax=Nitzschia inconspicua TaxID=303405 RepID=A0A9K3L8T6_9STRA|nr:ring finger domain containing protein [Nitzschia inconspicua]
MIPSISTAALSLLFTIVLPVRPIEASIQVVDLGRVYQSRPDKYVGLQMRTGLEYPARLQRISQNPHLCGNQPWNVTVPHDGLPVALLVKKGICTYTDKAEFASRYIHPPGIVKFLIIDGENSIRDENDEENLDEVIVEDETPHATAPTALDDESSVTLQKRKRRANDISVAVLHVSYRAGYELMEIVLGEERAVKSAGGTRVALDDVSPATSQVLMMLWIGLCAIIMCAACCCLAHAIANLLDAHNPPDDQHQQRRPRRRRLTLEQVRKIHVGVFDGTKLLFEAPTSAESAEEDILATPPTPSSHCLDCCSICLDEYVPGDKLRCLPCSHAFHSRCVARWLIERSSTCPLCKMDLYEEEEEVEEGDPTNTGQQPSAARGLFSSWASIPPETTTTTTTTTTATLQTPQNQESWSQSWRSRRELIVTWGRNVFVSPRQRRRAAASRVSESLAEPLLSHESQPHNDASHNAESSGPLGQIAAQDQTPVAVEEHEV